MRDRLVPPPPPPHHLYAKANGSFAVFLHWRRPAFTAAQTINYTIRCNPVGLQNASLVLYLQTYVVLAPAPRGWAGLGRAGPGFLPVCVGPSIKVAGSFAYNSFTVFSSQN